MSGGDGSSGSDEMALEQVVSARESLSESDENSFKRWVLLAGNRGVVAFSFLLAGMLVLVAIGVLRTPEVVRLATETEIVETLFFTFLSGTILLVSVAVSINSVVLSQELTSIGTQMDNVDESLEFRHMTQELTEPDVSPAQPAEFLLAVVRAVRTRTEQLKSTVPNDNSLLHNQVSEFTDDVVNQVDAVEGRLRKGEFGTSEVLLAGLDYDYSWQMYVVQRLQTEHGDSLSDEQQHLLDELVDILKQFTTGREYFKTLYFKRELANVSRWLLVIAFPVIVYLSYALLAFKANLIPEIPVLPVPMTVLFIAVSYVIALAPYALFTSYVLRLATIAYRTLAAGPFILESDAKRGRIEWGDSGIGDEPET